MSVTANASPSHRAVPGIHGAAVTLRAVRHVFGRGRTARPALDRLDIDVPPGQFLVLLGPSGCGKSTVLNLVAGFQRPTQGSVLVDDDPVQGPGADRGIVFQQLRLFPWMTVRANVEFGPRMAGRSAEERRHLAREALDLVGLGDVGDRSPHELSGGMQQRAAIARALGAHPRVLLMDEPFAALDALTRERLQDEVLRIWRATGTTVLFVTHSVDEAVYVGSRVLTLSAHPGTVVDDVPTPAHRGRDDPGLAAVREHLRQAVHRAAGRAA